MFWQTACCCIKAESCSWSFTVKVSLCLAAWRSASRPVFTASYLLAMPRSQQASTDNKISQMMPKINTDNSRAAQSFQLDLFVQLVKQQSVWALSLSFFFFFTHCLYVYERETKQMVPVADRIKGLSKMTEMFIQTNDMNHVFFFSFFWKCTHCMPALQSIIPGTCPGCWTHCCSPFSSFTVPILFCWSLLFSSRVLLC